MDHAKTAGVEVGLAGRPVMTGGGGGVVSTEKDCVTSGPSAPRAVTWETRKA